MSAISVRRLFLLLDPPELSEDLVADSLEEALSRTIQSIVDELSLRLYFSFTPEEAEMYLNPLKGWDTVIGRFLKMQYNVEESAKCFALERYGAAVFHILQVAEYGVIQVGKLMGELGDKPGWSCVQRLRKLISAPYPERTPLAQQHSKITRECCSAGNRSEGQLASQAGSCGQSNRLGGYRFQPTRGRGDRNRDSWFHEEAGTRIAAVSSVRFRACQNIRSLMPITPTP
jgi:hypothetical protein